MVGSPGNQAAVHGNGIYDESRTTYVYSTDAGISEIVDGLEQFTISWWIKGPGTNGNLGDWMIGNYTDGIFCYHSDGGAYYRHYFYINGNDYGNCATGLEYDAPILFLYGGQYRHWVWTYDGTQAVATDRMRVYVDNVDVYNNQDDFKHPSEHFTIYTPPTSVSMSTDYMYIGYNGNGWGKLGGGVDLFRMWSYAMTPAEVDKEWNGGSGRP